MVNVCPRFYTTWKGSSLRVFYLKGTYFFFGNKNQSEQNFQKIIIAPAACHAPVNRQPHPHPATQHHRVTFTTRSTGLIPQQPFTNSKPSILLNSATPNTLSIADYIPTRDPKRAYTMPSRLLTLYTFSRLLSTTPPRPSTPSLRELLSDSQLTELLRKHSRSISDSLLDDPSLRISVLSRLSQLTGRPIASDAFSQVGTAEEMARWYARNVRGERVKGYAKEMLGRERLGDEVQDEGKEEEVKEEFVKRLPGNLRLDKKTWEPSVKGKVRTKGRGM